MSSEERIKKLAQSFDPFNLPIGIYLDTKEGELLRCNKKCCEILNLDPDNYKGKSIIDFYRDLKDRERLVAQISESGVFEGEEVPFIVNGRDIWIRNSCCELKDEETGEVLGYMGSIRDITEEKNYQRLFDELPAGAYQLDADDKIVKVNDAVAKILGYNSSKELINKSVVDFLADKEDAFKLRDMVRDKDEAVEVKRELIKKNGEIITALVKTKRIISLDGKYVGREGTLRDITLEERYKQIFNVIPLGTYMLEKKNGKYYICECNEAFAEMFGFDNSEQAKGIGIRDLFQSPEDDMEELEKELDRKQKEGQPVIRYRLNVKTIDNKPFVIETNCSRVFDRRRKVVGRAGVIQDITKLIPLLELREDIGRVLHSYSTVLLMLRHSIDPVIKMLRPDPFSKHHQITAEIISEALIDPARNLSNSLNTILEKCRLSEEHKEALSQEHWGELETKRQVLVHYKEWIEFAEHQFPTLRQLVFEVSDILEKAKRKLLPPDLLKEAYDNIWELERIACLISLHQARDNIVEMDHQIRSLREYITIQQRELEKRTRCNIVKLINQACKNLSEYAVSKKVKIKREFILDNNKYIEIEERNILRALLNILHNAIKYSWSRKKGENPWIDIRAHIEDGSLLIDITNYGVPIPRDEIENELIFMIGYRGRRSGDRGRLGTGVGLHDARDTVQNHGGDLIVRSRPAKWGGDENDYSQPFLTTATIRLPLSVGEAKVNEA